MAFVLVVTVAAGYGASAPVAGDSFVLRDGLVLEAVAPRGRSPLPRDPVQAMIVSGTFTEPRVGDEVIAPDGQPHHWRAVTAADDGAFADLKGGSYVFVTTRSDARRVAILEARGHAMVYVNGVPRMGDPYGHGYVRLPVELRAGDNHLLFHMSRPPFRAQLLPVAAPVSVDAADATLPDVTVGQPTDAWAAVVVTNATAAVLRDLSIDATDAMDTGAPAVRTPLPVIPPMSVRKVGFRIAAPARAGEEPGEREVRISLVGGDNGQSERLHSTAVRLRVRSPTDSQRRTFVSEIDGSVQFYALTPAAIAPPPDGAAQPPPLPAMFLSLHGAAVDATNQARSYTNKTWGHVVAPTNRRPYGFDWEDWGRLDALEVLRRAQADLQTDPNRTYLLGHSMGGHGTWHIAATLPDHFAAIGPSAGWMSFASYGSSTRPSHDAASTRADDAASLLRRCASLSDTRLLLRNYSSLGVYAIHGDADETVPVAQSREMARLLGEFHRDWTYYEHPGGKHWWDDASTPGVDCVDWPPLFDFLARHRRPRDAEKTRVDFTTCNPGVSADCHWATIEAQERSLSPSTIRLTCQPAARRITGETDNVRRLALRPDPLVPGPAIDVELDGQAMTDLPWPTAERPTLRFERVAGAWRAVPAPPPPLDKSPQRYGPFKEAFQHRMMFVYGTRGSPEENAWAFQKARYDAEQFWYRGNGSIDVVADGEWDPVSSRDRSVILYGNADTNAAWEALLGDSPVQVGRGRISVAGRVVDGDDLACLFVRPRSGSDRACVAVVAGSGVRGMRLTDRLPYFVSGVHYPDWIVQTPDVFSRGPDGVWGAGLFGLDWSVETGESVWQDDGHAAASRPAVGSQ